FVSVGACGRPSRAATSATAPMHSAKALCTAFIASGAATLRQREHGQHTAELRMPAQRAIRADGTEAGRRFFEPGRHADSGPPADTGEHTDVLLALIRPGVDVADDSRRCLELVKLLARLRVDRLQIPFERAVEHHVA